jgi:hypothetical protein
VEQAKPAIPVGHESPCQSIPVVIEICEVSPARHFPVKNLSVKESTRNSKDTSRFEAAPKSQPIQFTSRPAKSGPSPAVNPFQLSLPSV